MLLYSYLVTLLVGYVTSNILLDKENGAKEIEAQFPCQCADEGIVDIEDVKKEQVDMYPTGSTGSSPNTMPMVVKIMATFPNGFKQGRQIQISGRVHILASSFYINLQDDESGDGRPVFVRNSWMNGTWGAEKRSPGFQFTPGKEFNLAICFNDNDFAVWVDDTLAVEFPFRTPVDKIDSVLIDGDVQVFKIYMKDHIDDKYLSMNKEKNEPTLVSYIPEEIIM